MKRLCSLLLSLVLLSLCLTGCVSQQRQLEESQSYLAAHRELLEDLAAQCQEEGRLPADLPGELEDAALYYDYATGMVQIQVGAWGLAPSSTHWGVYFSPEDSPLPYDGAQVALTPQEVAALDQALDAMSMSPVFGGTDLSAHAKEGAQ